MYTYVWEPHMHEDSEIERESGYIRYPELGMR